jgi:hypothetical protein
MAQGIGLLGDGSVAGRRGVWWVPRRVGLGRERARDCPKERSELSWLQPQKALVSLTKMAGQAVGSRRAGGAQGREIGPIGSLAYHYLDFKADSDVWPLGWRGVTGRERCRRRVEEGWGWLSLVTESDPPTNKAAAGRKGEANPPTAWERPQGGTLNTLYPCTPWLAMRLMDRISTC